MEVTVGIVGAGISGLTLAKMLEMQGISYVLLEARAGVAEAAGAGVGLMPNALRILDQLGLFDELGKHESPHHCWDYRDANGTLYKRLTAFKILEKELGYGVVFLERQELLEILYQSINNKSRIFFNKHVTIVSTLHDFAAITTADGVQVKCDFVAGADGIHSVVRNEIFRKVSCQQVPSTYLSSQYACVYGISYAIPQLRPGHYITVYREDISILVFSCSGGKLIWFLFIDLKTSMPLNHSKKYDSNDIEAVLKQISHVKIACGVEFRTIYNNRKAAVMTNLEEGVADVWTAGRLFLLGDAVHKFLPHNAMGAGQAIESAACFVNQLLTLKSLRRGASATTENIPLSVVENCLHEYEIRRKERTVLSLRMANKNCQFMLKKASETEQHLKDLVGVTDENFIKPRILDFCKAEKLENWPLTTNRIEIFNEHASIAYNERCKI